MGMPACATPLPAPTCRASLPLLAARPLVRLGLHPRDARHPELLRHLQRLLGALLAGRQPRTKAAYAETVVAGLHFR